MQKISNKCLWNKELTMPVVIKINEKLKCEKKFKNIYDKNSKTYTFLEICLLSL